MKTKKILCGFFLVFFSISLNAIPNTFLLGTNKGLSAFVGNSETSLWNEGEVKQIFNDGSKFVFLTSKGIIISTDLKTFSEKNEGLTFKTVKKYENGTKSFVREIQDLKDLHINPDNSQVMVTATKDAVFLTRDSGETWQSLGLCDYTAGAKAVAVANLPALTVFMSHPIKGVFYCQPDVSGKKWFSLSSGLKKMKTNNNADEVSDILITKNLLGETEIYASQSFFPCIYKLSVNKNFSKSTWEQVWQGSDFQDCIDSLCKTPNGISFISFSAQGKINELVLKNADTIEETAQSEVESTSIKESTQDSFVVTEFLESRAWIEKIDKTSHIPECMWIPVMQNGETTSYSFSELWLLDMSKKVSKYSETANHKYGMYIPTHQINYPEKFAEHKKTIKDNRLNMVVIDMKDDYGNLRFKTDNPLLLEKGRIRTTIDLDKVIPELKEQGLYLVARIVVFKDYALSKYKNQKYAVWDAKEKKAWQGYYLKKQEVQEEPVTVETSEESNSDGTAKQESASTPKKYEYVKVYYDEDWVDPYSEEVWEYNVTISQELIKKGFDEIQFDYIRFPTDGKNLEDAQYRWKDSGMDKESALMSFLSYARENIDAPISIDVYGANGWYRTGARTGQDVELLAKYTDVICPMFYPSHFEQGFLAYAPAIQRPYRIYYYGSFRNTIIARNRMIVRPYAQAFYLGVSYDKKYYDEEYVQRQVFGTRDSIDTGYTYWNNSGRYKDIRPHPEKTDPYPWKEIPEEAK